MRRILRILVPLCMGAVQGLRAQDGPLFDYRAHPDRRGGFEVRRDLIYGTGAVRAGNGPAVKELRADAFLPQSLEGYRKAAIIFIHGGGFVTGDKRDYHRECRHFAGKGMAAFAINYRLVGDRPPRASGVADEKSSAARAAAEDARTALRWVRANAGSFGIDPENIFLAGTSAGAVTALAAGVTGKAGVRGIVDFCGGLYDMVDSIDAGDPPILIYHGTEDRTVPFAQALAVRDRCVEVGLEHEFHPVEGGGHCPSRPAANGKGLRQLTHEFILKHLAGGDAPPARR